MGSRSPPLTNLEYLFCGAKSADSPCVHLTAQSVLIEQADSSRIRSINIDSLSTQ